MNNRKWFNGKLYRDTLRQMRIMGGTYLIICLAISWIPPVVMALENNIVSVGIEAFVPVLYMLMTIGTVTLIFNAFSHLFSRSASDCFHALPTRRIGVCLSRFLAVLTWLWGIIATTAIGTALMYGLLCGQWYMQYIPYLCGYFGTISLFFAAAALCGVSLTGTRFSAFIVSGLVAFLVRFLLLLFTIIMVYFAPVVSVHGLGVLLNPYFNIATSSIMLPFDMIGSLYYDFTSIMTNLWPMAYTFAVGMLYTALGVFLYHKRKSETAEKSAPNRIMQTLYRCGITLPFVLPFVMELSMHNDNLVMSFGDYPGMIVMALVISLLVYVSFEVITQKRFRGLIKTLPYYAVLVLFCMLFTGTAKSMAFKQQHILPGADEITGIELVANSYNSYTDFLVGDLVISNEQVDTLIANALKQNVEFYDRKNGDWIYASEITVNICLKNGGNLVRTIAFSQNDWALLQNALSTDAEYMQRLRQLPTADAIDSLYLSSAELTDEQLRRLYDVLTAELAALPDKDYVLVVNNADTADEAPLQVAVPDTLLINGHYMFSNYRTQIIISSLTPHTLAYYVSMVQQNSISWFDANLPMSLDKDAYVDVSLTLFDLTSGKAASAYEGYGNMDGEETGDQQTKESILSVFSLMRTAMYQPQSTYLLWISLSISGESIVDENGYSGYDSKACLVYLTQEQAQTLQTMMVFQ